LANLVNHTICQAKTIQISNYNYNFLAESIHLPNFFHQMLKMSKFIKHLPCQIFLLYGILLLTSCSNCFSSVCLSVCTVCLNSVVSCSAICRNTCKCSSSFNCCCLINSSFRSEYSCFLSCDVSFVFSSSSYKR